MVVGVGFEPTYATRADLQSAAFNHSATPPYVLNLAPFTLGDYFGAGTVDVLFKNATFWDDLLRIPRPFVNMKVTFDAKKTTIFFSTAS